MILNVNHLHVCANVCKPALHKAFSFLAAVKHSYKVYLCIILLLFFATSCNRPDAPQIQDNELIEQLQELHSLHRTAPDSLLVILDEIRNENEHTMSAGTKALYYNLRAAAYQTGQRLEASQTMLSRGLQHLDNLTNDDIARRASLLNIMAGNYMIMGNLKEAINTLQQIRTLVSNFHDMERRFMVYINKGIAFSAMGNTHSALYYMQLANDIATKTGHREGKAFSFSNLGTLFNSFGNFSQAEENFREAISIFKELNDKLNIWSVYNCLTFTLISQGRIEESLLYAQKLNEIAASLGIPATGMHQYYTYRGLGYLAKSNYRRGLELFYKALELRAMTRNVRLVAGSHSNLSLAYARLGDFYRATFYANQALEVAKAQNVSHLQLEIYRNLLYIHAANGDIDNFLVTLENEQALRDSVFSEQSTRALHEMQARYETEINQLQLVQKRKDIQQQYTIITILIIGLIAVTLLSIMIVFHQKRKAQGIARIVQQYESILDYKKEEKASKIAKIDSTTKKLLDDLQHLFEVEKIYRNPKLNKNEVVEKLGTNRTYLSHLFNQELQTSFRSYVNTYRISEAIAILKEQDKGGEYAHYTIQAIAEAAGFNSLASFYSTFKDEVGVTPTEYKDAIKRMKTKIAS